MTRRDDDLYEHIPLEKLTTPFEGATVILNRWWLIDQGHALRFRSASYQCNALKAIVEHVRGDRLLDIIFIPVAYVPR